MDEAAPVLVPPRDRWLDRIQAVLEVLLVSGLVSSLFAAIPFSAGKRPDALLHNARLVAGFILVEAVITLFFIFVLLRVHRETLVSFGLRRRHWAKHAMIGIAVVPLLFMTNIVIAEVFRRYLPAYYLDRNPLIDLIKTPADFTLFLLSALLAGGIKEELQRAFILTRFRQHLGGVWVGLILWSIAFAAGHYLQGMQGVVVAGILGLFFGVLYLASRSIIAPVVSHAAYDAIVLAGYWAFLRTS